MRVFLRLRFSFPPLCCSKKKILISSALFLRMSRNRPSFGVALLVMACVCVGLSVADPIPANYTHVSGTYFSVGYQVGKAFRSCMVASLAAKKEMMNFAMTNPHAQHMNSSMFNATAKYFPNIVQEMRGLAEGAGISFREIFFLNTVSEYGLLLEYLKPHHGKRENNTFVAHNTRCTDVRSVAGQFPVWGHNEDGDIPDIGATYIVSAVIYGDGGHVVENFTAYSYPGSVAGRAYGWNSYGVITALNEIFAVYNDYAGPDAVPRAVLGRAINAATSVENAINILLTHNPVVSFSSNIGVMARNGDFWTDATQFANVEIDPRGTRAVTRLRRLPVPADKELPRAYDHFYHTNNYVTLNTPQYTDTSSSHRMARLAEMPVPATEGDVRNMLGDTKDAEWPLWRRTTRVDDMLTLSTAIFRFDLNEAWIYNDNPKTSQPFMKFRVI